MKSYRLLLIALALLCAPTIAYAQKTKAVLGAEINQQFPDNANGSITPQVLRNVTTDIVNSAQQYTGVNPQAGTTYTIQLSDYGQLVTFNNSSAVAVSLPQASGSFSIFNFMALNIGTGAVTITPQTGSTINGAASFTINQNQSVVVVSDGTNYQVARGAGAIPNPMPLGQGGTNANITASNNSLVYSTATSFSLLSTLSGGLLNTDASGAPSITATPTLGVAGSTLGSVAFSGNTSGTTTLRPGSAASGTLTLPAETGTLITQATTKTLTNTTYDTAGTGNSFSVNGLAATANTGTGAVARATSPVFVTPTLGAAIATTVNKVTITQPATGSILTIPDGVTMTGPASSATVAALNLAGQTISGGANVTTLSQSTGNITVDCGQRPSQSITNGGAFTITAPANDGYCILAVTNNASAGAITFSGFSVGSSTGDPLTTTNASKFFIFIYRAGGASTYRVAALQ